MGITDELTGSEQGSSALSSSEFTARPKAQSWMKTYEPLAQTASATCGADGEVRQRIIDVCGQCAPSSRPGLEHQCKCTERWEMSRPPDGWGWPQLSEVIQGLKDAVRNM